MKQILIGDPQELETEFMNMQLMIESAIVDNMTKYWAEGSLKNGTSIANILADLLNEMRGDFLIFSVCAPPPPRRTCHIFT